MTRVVRCGRLQVGSDVPMSEPVETIKAALNENCTHLIAEAADRMARILARRARSWRKPGGV